MTSKDKVIMYLLDDTCVDTCTKCIYDGWWKDENSKGCPEQNKHGDDACRKGMVAWFDKQERYGKTLGERIRLKRLEKRLSQTQLAEKIGVSEPCISKYEADDVSPSVLTLACIADVLECTTDELLGRL